MGESADRAMGRSTGARAHLAHRGAASNLPRLQGKSIQRVEFESTFVL